MISVSDLPFEIRVYGSLVECARRTIRFDFGVFYRNERLEVCVQRGEKWHCLCWWKYTVLAMVCETELMIVDVIVDLIDQEMCLMSKYE